MFKRIAILTTAVLMAGLLVVPLVMAQCIVPDCTHPNCPACPIPDCPDCQAHQFQCRSRASKGCVNGTGKMKFKSPEYITTYLYEKDPTTWDVVANGGAAMLKYLPEGEVFHFMLTAVNLTPHQNYSLIYYPDPFPGNGLICLGSNTAGVDGRLHMKTVGTGGTYTPPVDTGDLPAEGDLNTGAKIWLVLTDDIGGVCSEADHMTAWNPTEYLFENSLIYFADTDD